VSLAKRFLVGSVVVACASSALAAEPSFGPACEKALGGRQGAVIVLSLPDGKVLFEHDHETARRKFRGCSVYKPLTAYALLKERLVKPEETVTSSQKVTVERYGVTLESRYETPGRDLDLSRALALSANSYFYVMGARIEPEKLLEYYEQLDLGGCVRPPATPEEKAALPAHGGECVSASGEDLVPYLKRLALDPSPEMATVREGLRLAVTEGTGQGADIEGMEVFGKTGSLNGCGMFIGFAPGRKPTLGIVVILPGGAGTEAATVAGEVLRTVGTPASESAGAGN